MDLATCTAVRCWGKLSMLRRDREKKTKRKTDLFEQYFQEVKLYMRDGYKVII